MRIRLADDTIIENGRVGYAEGFLWCWITGSTMQEIAMLFFDPAKTAVIVFEYSGAEDRYEGFTECRALSVNVDGIVSVCMTRGAANG